jgi:hypothetical protein
MIINPNAEILRNRTLRNSDGYQRIVLKHTYMSGKGVSNWILLNWISYGKYISL